VNPDARNPYLRTMADDELGPFRQLIHEVIEGERPEGRDFDACRAVFLSEPSSQGGFQALCMLLEGLLADPDLPIDDTHTVVRLLKALAHGTVQPQELVP